MYSTIRTYSRSFFLEDFNNVRLLNALIAATAGCGATIFKVDSHTFYPLGFSAVIILGESHSALHTFPEYKRVWVEIATCSDTQNPDKFMLIFQQESGARNSE